MEKLIKFIRKYERIVHFVILIIGIGLITAACLNFPSDDQPDSRLYDVLLSLGCGIVATEIIAILLSALIPRWNEKNANRWMPVDVHSERSKIVIVDRNFPKHNLDYIAFGLRHFRSSNKEGALAEKVKKGVVIRIVTMDPNSYFLAEHAHFENRSDTREEINELIQLVENVKTKTSNRAKPAKGSIEIRFYDSLPFLHYCRSDTTVYAGPYLPGKESRDVITSQYDIHSEAGAMYAKVFEDLWTGQSPIKLTDKPFQQFNIDIEKAIHLILDKYSKGMQGNLKKPVIGIVVLFKGDRRRTLYSSGKTEKEEHHSHKKEDGVVGLMVRVNRQDRHPSVMYDYDNELAFEYINRGREALTTKMKVDEAPGRLNDDEDTKMIIASPIWKGDMIGAVTFDFAEIPETYQINVDRLKAAEEKERIEESSLDGFFEMAVECSELLSHLIGDNRIKQFYEENW